MTQVLHRSRKKNLLGKHWTLQHAKTTVNLEKNRTKKSPSNYVRPLCYSKHHKHKTSDAETGENRSFPRQLQRGVEHVLRCCEKSSAAQPTVYPRLAAMTQLFHRSGKKYLIRKHWTLQHARTTVNREQCPSKISPLKYVWPLCYSQTSQA